MVFMLLLVDNEAASQTRRYPLFQTSASLPY